MRKCADSYNLSACDFKTSDVSVWEISLFAISGGQVNAENSCYNLLYYTWNNRVSASASALMPRSMLENDTDIWYGLYSINYCGPLQASTLMVTLSVARALT